MAKGKKKPPSRVRYEAANPTVSCRVSRDIYNRLKEIKRNEGRTQGDVLKVGLGILEVKVGKEGEVFQRGYADGCENGRRDAESLWKVTFCCHGCGDLIDVATEELREAATECMQEHRWGHLMCIEELNRRESGKQP